jgi:hypothetical protein
MRSVVDAPNDEAMVVNNFTDLPQAPGVGFALRSETDRVFRSFTANV